MPSAAASTTPVSGRRHAAGAAEERGGGGGDRPTSDRAGQPGARRGTVTTRVRSAARPGGDARDDRARPPGVHRRESRPRTQRAMATCGGRDHPATGVAPRAIGADRPALGVAARTGRGGRSCHRTPRPAAGRRRGGREAAVPGTQRAGAAIPRDSDPGREPLVRSPATGGRSFACEPVTRPAPKVSPSVRRIVQVTGRGTLRCARSAERITVRRSPTPDRCRTPDVIPVTLALE